MILHKPNTRSTITCCRGFRHEKTKKKRGTYRGGQIDLQTHSIKFENSDDEWNAETWAFPQRWKAYKIISSPIYIAINYLISSSTKKSGETWRKEGATWYSGIKIAAVCQFC